MSYSHALGNPPTARRTQDRRLAAGQKILVRLRPHGVNSANQSGVFVELDRAMANLGIFGRPEFREWGGGARTPDSSGMIVYQAPLTTGRYTPTELVSVVARAIRGTEAALGAKRLSVVTVRWLEAPRGALVVYKAPQTTSQRKDRPSGDAPAPAPATPEASAADAAAPAADQPSAEPATPGAPATASPAATEENFFTRKVGGVPVYAIAGGAVLTVLAAGGLYFLRRRRSR